MMRPDEDDDLRSFATVSTNAHNNGPSLLSSARRLEMVHKMRKHKRMRSLQEKEQQERYNVLSKTSMESSNEENRREKFVELDNKIAKETFREKSVELGNGIPKDIVLDRRLEMVKRMKGGMSSQQEKVRKQQQEPYNAMIDTSKESSKKENCRDKFAKLDEKSPQGVILDRDPEPQVFKRMEENGLEVADAGPLQQQQLAPAKAGCRDNRVCVAEANNNENMAVDPITIPGSPCAGAKPSRDQAQWSMNPQQFKKSQLSPVNCEEGIVDDSASEKSVLPSPGSWNEVEKHYIEDVQVDEEAQMTSIEVYKSSEQYGMELVGVEGTKRTTWSKRFKYLCLAISVLVITILITVGVFFATNQGDANNSTGTPSTNTSTVFVTDNGDPAVPSNMDSTNQGGVDNSNGSSVLVTDKVDPTAPNNNNPSQLLNLPTEFPSIAPTESFAPSHSPSFSPETMAYLPVYTMDAIQAFDAHSVAAQVYALDFVRQHATSNMTDDDKKQLLGLTTLLYSASDSNTTEEDIQATLEDCQNEQLICSSEDGVLQDLNFALAGFNGTIPPEASLLTGLRNLALQHNDLHGPLPTELGALTHLTSLALLCNRLTGRLPTQIGLWQDLEFLGLYENHFHGPIPNQIGLLSSLSHFDCHDCGLEGALPPEMALLTSMTTLSLTDNHLTGSIPDFSNMTDLWELHLSNNQFRSSDKGAELMLPASLVHLSLDGNAFEGPIPFESFSSLSNLGSLALHNNSYTGTVPRSICGLTRLRTLSVDCDKVGCSCPQCACL